MPLRLSKKCKGRIRFGRKIDFLFRQLTLVSKETDLDFCASLATGRKYDPGTREVADMKAIVTVSITSIGTVTNLYPIGSVFRDNY